MGHSRAYAVFRTTDAREAYARAGRLVGLLARVEAEMYVETVVRTVAEARRMVALLPGATVDHAETAFDPDTGACVPCPPDMATATDAAIQAELPLVVAADVPVGSVDEEFLRGLGDGPASMDWRGLWPEDPEAEGSPSAQYDGVQVVFHADEAQWTERTAHHTVFVHVRKPGDAARAAGLAALIGGEVLGDVQIGW